MPVHNNNIKTNKHSNNIFELMEGMIDQLNNTKRLFIVMILTVMIIPPLVFIITFELINCYSSSFDNPPTSVSEINHYNGEHREDPFGNRLVFTITRDVPLIIGIIWLGVGIRQWIVLSGWNKRYQRYKELRRKIDEKINNEEDTVNNIK